jgi:hypothetical protein
MKLKLQIDQKAVQEFFLQNVEKIGLGIVVCIFLFMVYSAVSRVQRYKPTPDDLVKEVKRGQDEINRTDPDSVLIEMTNLTADEYKKKYDEGYGKQEGERYVDQAKGSRVRIVAKPYACETAYDPLIFPPLVKRTAPPLLAVQQLRGEAGVGAFRLAAAPAGGAAAAPPARDVAGPLGPGRMGQGANDVQGQRWIVVTGLVPVEKQELAYSDTFKSAVGYDPNKDVPEYWGYQVQRVEVASPGEVADPDWEKADKPFTFPKDAQKVMEKWANVGAEVVAPEYVNETLVFPLGPMEGRPWGESVGHPLDIPVQKANQLGPGTGVPPGMMQPGAGGGNGGTRIPRAAPRDPVAPGAGGRTPPAGDNPFGGDRGGPGAIGPGGPGEPSPAAGPAKPPAFLLFRYFDYNVEPGKHYVYRVQLALRNPNQEVKPVNLKDPELAKPAFLLTKWSDLSPAISVPRETRVLLVSVAPGRSNHEPSGKVMVAKWVEKNGIEAHGDFSMVRGQVADFKQKFTPPNPLGAGAGQMGGMPPGGTPGLGTPPAAAPGGGAGRVHGAPAPRRAAPPAAPPSDARGGAHGRAAGGGAAPRDLAPPRAPGGGMPTPAAVTNEIEVDYVTGVTAIDFRGGQPLAATGRRGNSLKLCAVGEVLFLDPDGTLVVRNELDDESARKELTKTEDDAEAARRRAAATGGFGGGLEGLGPPPAKKKPAR